MAKFPPKHRRTSYSSLKRIARRLGLRVTVKRPAALDPRLGKDWLQKEMAASDREAEKSPNVMEYMRQVRALEHTQK